jgi:hypothetical protein
MQLDRVEYIFDPRTVEWLINITPPHMDFIGADTSSRAVQVSL